MKVFWQNDLEIDRSISIFLKLIVDVFNRNDKQFYVFLLRNNVICDDTYKSHIRRRQTFFRARIFRRSFNFFVWFNFRNSDNIFVHFRSDFFFSFFPFENDNDVRFKMIIDESAEFVFSKLGLSSTFVLCRTDDVFSFSFLF